MSIEAVTNTQSLAGKNPFDQLPDEILVNIFQYIGDPYSLGAVSRRWHAVAWDSSFVQVMLKKIEQKIGKRSYQAYLKEIKKDIIEPSPQQILQALVNRICKKAKLRLTCEGHGAIRCIYSALYPFKKLTGEDLAIIESIKNEIKDFSDVIQWIEGFNRGNIPESFFPKSRWKFFLSYLGF